jgi:hypothetical protein
MLKIGDYAIQDCRMPYPNTIYRVEEVDECGNFRGPAVFRLTSDPTAYPTRKGQWLGYHAFRAISKDEIRELMGMLASLLT